MWGKDARKTRRWLARIAASIAVAAIVFYAWWPWSTVRRAMTRRDGESIIVSIEAFKRDHGEYPRSLKDLIPAYIGSIPTPVAGDKRWSYARYDSKQGFHLGVNNGVSYGSLMYFTEHGQWILSDF